MKTRPVMSFFWLSLLFGGAQAGDALLPPDAFDHGRKYDATVAAHYAVILTAAKEPAIFSNDQNPKTESYRFIWWRSFHPPVVLRVEVQGDSGQLFIKTLGRGETDDDWRLLRNETKILSQDELGKLQARFRLMNFWKMPKWESETGTDGSTWTFEARVDGRYHLATRWSPKNGPFHDFGIFLIETAIGGDLVPIY